MSYVYIVSTRDVDCSTRKRFKTLDGARKRFEEMLGRSIESAIDETYYDVAVKPTPETVTRLRDVSMYGTVVMLERRDAA